MERIGLTIVLTALLSAPAWAGQFKEQDTLKPDEGILATTLTCGHPIAGVQLFRAGKSSGGFWGPLKSDGSIACGKAIRLVRLKAGRYYIGQFYSGTDNLAVPEDKSPQFNIEAGKLNYIGDLYAGDVSVGDVDEQTLMRIVGRMLTALNHEPQAREILEREYAGVLSRYPFVADAALSPVVPASAPAAPPVPGQMQGIMTVSAARWKRGADGQPLICRQPVPLPKGAKLAPGEELQCSDEFITPEAYVVAKNGPGTQLGSVQPQGDDNSTLVMTFTGPPPAK
jgi:hypothetical protein